MKEEDLVKSIMERMTPYWKAMDEILEERVKETKAYKELLEENKKLKYVIDTLMEKTNIDHITLASWEMFVNPSKRLRLSDDFEKCGK